MPVNVPAFIESLAMTAAGAIVWRFRAPIARFQRRQAVALWGRRLGGLLSYGVKPQHVGLAAVLWLIFGSVMVVLSFFPSIWA